MLIIRLRDNSRATRVRFPVTDSMNLYLRRAVPCKLFIALPFCFTIKNCIFYTNFILYYVGIERLNFIHLVIS